MRGDAVNPSALSSSINPTLSDGSSSHSHLPELIGVFSFVSAWDLYLIALAEASSITVIGSSEDRGAVPEPCVCACVSVCAILAEDETQTGTSLIVPSEGSQ